MKQTKVREGMRVRGPFWDELVKIVNISQIGEKIQLGAKGEETQKYYDPLLSIEEIKELKVVNREARYLTGNPEATQMAVIARRIRRAYSSDSFFGLNISKIDPVPHQLEAVYDYILKKYKEKLRLKNVEEKVKVMSNKKIEDVNEKFYGRVEDAINTVSSALNEVAGGIIEMVKNKVGEGWYEKTSLESIRKVINGEYNDSIESEEIKELAEVNKDLRNMIDNCERKGKEGGVNAFKIVDHMESFYSKSTTVIREALKDLKAKVGKDEKNNVSNIINELNVEGTFCNKLDSARKKIIEQRDIIYKKVFTSLPSSIEALSLLYRTSIAVQGGKSLTSIPKSSYLGEMALVWNQVLRMFGNEVATTAQNIINTSKWQTRGALQYFLNSNSFLTESFARSLLMTFHGVWMKKTGEKSSISETGKIIDRVISNENYVIGNVQHRYYKDWTILKRLKYFVGYWFVGKKDFDSKGKELLRDLEKNGEFKKDKLAEAVSTFKRRIAKGKAVRISGVMRQILGKVLADSYSQVYAQIQISAAKIAQADNIEDLSLSLARLAYAQNIYKEESRAAALMLDAINEIKKVKERKRKFEGKEPLDYAYDDLIDELENLNDNWKKYNCDNIKKRLEWIKKKIGDEIKEKFSEIKALYRTVRNGIVKDKGLFSHFRKKNARAILEDIKEGKVFEGIEGKVKNGEKEAIKERLQRLIETETLLIKNGQFNVMGINEQTQLLGMSLRMRSLGMIAERVENQISIASEKTISWSTSNTQSLFQHMSDERRINIVERMSIEEIKRLVLTQIEKKSLSFLFKGENSLKDGEDEGNEGKSLETLKDIVHRKINTEVENGNNEKAKKLKELKTKLGNRYCKNLIGGIKEKALSLKTAIKMTKEGKVATNHERKPELTNEAKKQLKKGLMAKGFSSNAAEKMSKHLEDAIREEIADNLAAKTLQERKKTLTDFFMSLTPLGAMGLMVHRIISFIMSNTRCQKLLQNSFMSNFMKKMKNGKVGGYIRNLIQNFYTGFIVGLMSFIGMIIGMLLVRLTTDTKGMKKAFKVKKSNGKTKDLGDALKENSSILGILWLKLPTIAWVIISTVLFPLLLVLISQKYLKDISTAKGGAAIFTGVTGIWAYTKMNKQGWFDSIPFFVSLSGMLWIWDEFDDFQDAKEQISGGDGGGTGLVDYAELFLLPFILGFFGAMFGMVDPMALVIPGNLGFMRYTTSVLPNPWNWILHSLYRVVATVIGGIIASGGVGGFAIYMIGSVLANFAMKGVISIIS